MPDGQSFGGVTNSGKIEYSASGLVFFYNMICSARGFSMPQHLVPMARALVDDRIPYLLITIGPGSGKALRYDTPVLFEGGWRPISSAKVGDRVYGPAGRLVNVRGVRWTLPEPLWRVRFSDGREVVTHANHLWQAHHKKFRREGRGEAAADGLLWDTVSTVDIATRMDSARDLRWYVPLTGPVEFPEQRDLPFPPYSLGVVLGDGSIAETGYVRVTNPEPEIAEELKRELVPLGYEVRSVATNSSGCPNWSIPGSSRPMTLLGLRHKRSWEKFIPAEYKIGSAAQRLALLQGLLDTDGNANSAGGVNYSTTSPQLAADVQELVWSLGGMAKLVERQTYFTSHGQRKPGRKSWRISIRFRDPRQLFRLPRKRDLLGYGQYSDTLKLHIVSIEREQEPQASVCISVDSEDGLFLADNYVVTHNSTILSEIFPAFLLGHDPTQTILAVSAGEALMQGFLRSVMETVEWSPFYSKMFPKVRPDKSAGWSSERGMFVTGREIGNPDANMAAAGLDSKSLTGKHAKTIICDDLHDKENSATTEQIEKVWNTWFNTILGRADPRGARYIVAGRRYNQEDLYARLKRTGEWVVIELPALREGTDELWVDVTVPHDLVCCFTEDHEPEPVLPSRRRVRTRVRLPE